MDYAERMKGRRPATLMRWQQISNDRERPILRAAVRVDQRARGGAQTRPAHRIAQQSNDRRLELTWVVHLEGRAIRQERLRDLVEVLHMRPEDDGFAVEGRLEDVVSAGGHQAPANEDGGSDL